MVNTRILESQVGWRRAAADGRAANDEAPRGLQHEPLLQGRVQGGGRAPLPLAAGLNGPRHRIARAAVDDTWAALEPLADTLESAAARRGALPPIDRASAAGAMFDQLRTALLRTATAQSWRRIGVTAPRRGAGASFVSIGLAASIARLDYLRLALLDLDLSHPALARHLGLTAPQPLDAMLRGQAPPVTALARVGANLAVVLNGQDVAAAADLLHAPEAILALRALADALDPDLMIVDLPPLLTDPAAQAAAAQVDAVLLVADGTQTTARDVTDCERVLKGQTPVAGVVLNKSEDRPPPAFGA